MAIYYNKMEQIKIIETQIKSILKDSKDFIKLHNDFNELLSEIYRGFNDLNSKKVKLLNILFKHSKKKILFKWDYEVENGYSKDEKREYTIGINTAGLGLSSHYEHSLRNITDYYAKDNFSKLFKNPEFVKKLLGCVKKDKAKIIPNLLTKDKNDFEKKIEVGKVLITIKNHLNYNNKDYVGYRSEIEIIDKKIQPFNKEDDSDYYLSEISDLNLELSLKDLLEFSWLLNSKDKVIIKLQEELKNYHLIKKEIDKKTAVVDKELKPYEALEQI